MDTYDSIAKMTPESRQAVIGRIMGILQKHIPHSGTVGINDLRKIAVRFEDKIYNSSANQEDYLRKISMKMLTMQTKAKNVAGSSPSIPATNNGTSMDSGSFPTQEPHPLLSQTMQSNTATGVTRPPALPSSMLPVSSITNKDATSVVNQNSNMQNVVGMLQDSSGQHGLSSIMFSGSQRQMLGRPHDMSSQQQQHTQTTQYLYQQKRQQQLLKQNFQSGNAPNHNSLLSSHMQQNVLHPNQLHSSQHSGIPISTTQPSTVNSASLQGLHTNQQSCQQTTQSMLRQHQSSVLRSYPQSQHASGLHQQQPSSPQQQAKMMRQQAANNSGVQQKQMMGQLVVGDMQQQHQQMLLDQQNNILNIRQQQSPAQQQLMSQQNSIQATHQQPLGTQSNATGLQQPQQQLLGSQVANSGLQTNQNSVKMLTQPTGGAGCGLFSSQSQQSQNQPSQQQMIPQLQSHHQQLGLQQPPSLVQQDVQQRLQASGQVTGSVLSLQNVVDQLQQRQLYQSQRTLPEMPSSSFDSTAQKENANGGDWREELFQKIQSMKKSYLPDLSEIYQRIAARFQQVQDYFPQQQRSDQIEKLKKLKIALERMILFISLSKSNPIPAHKGTVDSYENHILDCLKYHKLTKTAQLPQSQMQPMQQPQSQTVQDQSHDDQTNPQMQSMNMHGSGPMTQQSSLKNMQNNGISSRSGVSAQHQNITSSIPASRLESGQGNALNNGQQVAMGTMQQVNNSTVSAQSRFSTLQSNVNQTQLNSSLVQPQNLKQQQDQQMTQQQQLKQQQRQMQARQQAAQLQQMNDMNEFTARQGMNASRGNIPQHSLQGQLPVSSPQLLQDASTQQHLSPQVDQKNLSSVNKISTPLLPANSPFVDPFPSTPMVPSPLQVDSEKPSGANITRQQATAMQDVTESLAISTPGISTSPLFQEITSPEGNDLNPLTSEKPEATELPIERLIRAVKSISPEALSSAVGDIESVVRMVDRIAGSAPGNGSKTSAGEDLVAMTKCRLQARNFMTMATKKRRHITAIRVDDNYKQFSSDMESTATSNHKKARTELEHVLVNEIKEINQRLIDTNVEIIDDEDSSEGTRIRFSFTAVSISSDLKAHLSSTQTSSIQPLDLLVPCSYPNSSPFLLDNLTSKDDEDLSTKAMGRLNRSLRSLSQPMSVKDIAKTWESCARDVICDYAKQFGGGTFSSKYGTWENYVAAS